ncbi:MAG: response regulator [Pyrinomonadaceae bacterium]
MKKCKILLVEDNPDDEMLCLRALKKNNITNEIVIAHDGAEALDYLFADDSHAESADELPHLMLLDLKLPKVSGLEVLERVRANPRTKLLPTVILTTSVEEQDLLQSYSLGVNSYIRKPVDFAEFTEVVRQLGLYWLLLNQNPQGGTCEDEYTASAPRR